MTLIGVIVVAICTVPLVGMYIKKKNKEHKMLDVLKDLATKQDCNITEHEFCRNFAIAIDQSKHFLFFDKHSEQAEDALFINLEEIKSSKVVKTMREGSKVSVIQKVELVLTPSTNAADIKLELYNDNSNMQINEELQMAEKWSEIINNQLKNR